MAGQIVDPGQLHFTDHLKRGIVQARDVKCCGTLNGASVAPNWLSPLACDHRSPKLSKDGWYGPAYRVHSRTLLIGLLLIDHEARVGADLTPIQPRLEYHGAPTEHREHGNQTCCILRRIEPGCVGPRWRSPKVVPYILNTTLFVLHRSYYRDDGVEPQPAPFCFLRPFLADCGPQIGISISRERLEVLLQVFAICSQAWPSTQLLLRQTKQALQSRHVMVCGDIIWEWSVWLLHLNILGECSWVCPSTSSQD